MTMYWSLSLLAVLPVGYGNGFSLFNDRALQGSVSLFNDRALPVSAGTTTILPHVQTKPSTLTSPTVPTAPSSSGLELSKSCVTCGRAVMGIEEIKKLIPHRFPFLFVDRVLYLDADCGVGYKQITGNDHFFEGHFPTMPVMPGVIQVEGLAQMAGIVLSASVVSSDTTKSDSDGKAKIFLFARVSGVSWKKPVVPGDTLVYDVKILSRRGTIVTAEGRGYVGGVMVVEVQQMTFSVPSSKK